MDLFKRYHSPKTTQILFTKLEEEIRPPVSIEIRPSLFKSVARIDRSICGEVPNTLENWSPFPVWKEDTNVIWEIFLEYLVLWSIRTSTGWVKDWSDEEDDPVKIEFDLMEIALKKNGSFIKPPHLARAEEPVSLENHFANNVHPKLCDYGSKTAT